MGYVIPSHERSSFLRNSLVKDSLQSFLTLGTFGSSSGKAAIFELETISYNDETGALLCMNRYDSLHLVRRTKIQSSDQS